MPITRSSFLRLALLLMLAVVTSGCAIAGGIFKAGFWSGIIVVVLIVVVLGFIVGKSRG